MFVLKMLMKIICILVFSETVRNVYGSLSVVLQLVLMERAYASLTQARYVCGYIICRLFRAVCLG